MKPRDYLVGGKDSAGNTVKSILDKSETAVVYTTENNQLRWDYDADELPTNVRPAVSYFDRLMARIRTSGMEPLQKETAYFLLGHCLYHAMVGGDPATNDQHFADAVKFLKEHATRRWIVTKFTSLSWPARVASVLGVVVLGSASWALADAYFASKQTAREILCQAKISPNELVVLVHGYRGSLEKMDGVIQAIREERPSADVLFFNYPSSIFANTDPFALADQLEKAIAKQDATRSYQRIILSGHSTGALIARKAFLISRLMRAASFEDVSMSCAQRLLSASNLP